ncbi:MAG TPA: efflux RND transporter periplasmic adaptor subunit [Paenalcaligenes sp.]|nr:efflux RND transporter periplasmic adaptor subunit [Paenalcaligenes sp.]
MPRSRFFSRRLLQVFLFSTVLVVAACGKQEEQSAQSDMKVPVQVVQVNPEPTPLYIDLPGRADAIKDAQVRARVTGIVTGIHFEQGSDVEEGQLLFTIDPAPYEAARNQAKARLQQAEATAQSAASLANRYQRLIKERAISQQDYDTAMAQHHQAQAEVAGAKAALESAEIDLGYTEVTAPISGRIGKAEVTEGALVSATEASHLATIQQIDELYIDIRRPAEEFIALRKAIASGLIKSNSEGEAQVTALLGDRSEYPEKGRLLFSGVSVDPTTGQLAMRAIFPNPDLNLLPGMFVRVRVEQGIKEDALAVPVQAIQYGAGGSTTVYIVDEDDKAQIVPVKVGQQIKGLVVVEEGLDPEATVVVAGFQKIQPGAPVQPMPWEDDDPESAAEIEGSEAPESQPETENE